MIYINSLVCNINNNKNDEGSLFRIKKYKY